MSHKLTVSHNKLYSSHQEKKEGTSMWNAWAFWVFVPQILPILPCKLKIITYKSSSAIPPSSKSKLLCQYEMNSWHYIVTKTSIIDVLEVRDPPLVCFLWNTYSKRLKFNEVDIYKFKIKKQSTRVRKKVTPKLAIKATKWWTDECHQLYAVITFI